MNSKNLVDLSLIFHEEQYQVTFEEMKVSKQFIIWLGGHMLQKKKNVRPPNIA